MRTEMPRTEGVGDVVSPIIGRDHATFRYTERPAHAVSFVADSTDWRPVPMEAVENGWQLTRSYPEDARDEYMFVVDGEYILDPCNPLIGTGVFGMHSECCMPRFRHPPLIEPPVEGRLERRRLAGRSVQVYVPMAVKDAAVLVVQDGADYVWLTGMPGLLDRFIREGRIPPTLAVFVTPRNRDEEYRPNDRYVGWLADRLMPAVQRRYGTHPEPDRHGLVGASLGGLIASYGALSRPDVFRLVGAQSPAYRLMGDLSRWLDTFGLIDWPSFRFHVDGGTFETILHGREYLPVIRRGAELLREKGCAVQYNDVNEGHNWTNWRGRLPNLLTWLLGNP